MLNIGGCIFQSVAVISSISSLFPSMMPNRNKGTFRNIRGAKLVSPWYSATAPEFLTRANGPQSHNGDQNREGWME